MLPESPHPARPDRTPEPSRRPTDDRDRPGSITVQLATGMAMTLACRPPRTGEPAAEG